MTIAWLKRHPVVSTIGVVVLLWAFFNYVLPAIEGFDNPSTKVNPKCPWGYRQCPSGDCVDAQDPHQTCPESTDAY